MRRRSSPSRQGQLTLPAAPSNSSPVPWLTSLHSSMDRGPWGSSAYRGNCGGYLIKDLLRFFGAKRVLDPMTGSGTCRDVCADLDIPCTSFDLKAGQDAGDPASYAGLLPHDFAWLHPPYWRQVPYGDDPRCLSRAPSLEAFLERMDTVLAACRDALTPSGHVAVLVGGYSDRGRYMPLPALITARAAALGLWPACTEIVRFQHGNTSSRRHYRSSFVPGLHDVCTVYRRVQDPPSAKHRRTNVHIDILNTACDTRRGSIRQRRARP